MADERGGLSGNHKNPFRAQALRPGTIPFHFAPGHDLPQLMATLAARHHWGQIVGPHGSGKSTLWRQLVQSLQDEGRTVLAITCSANTCPTIEMAALAHQGAVLAVDGFEQLSWWRRWRLRHVCWRRRAGLLLTTHRRQWCVPVLCRTRSDPAIFVNVVRQLWQREHKSLEHFPAEWTDEFLANLLMGAGNVREALFALYDRYHRHRPKCTDAGTREKSP